MITLMLFTADHCRDCRLLQFKCEQIVLEDDDIRLEVYNIDESQSALELFKESQLRAVPTIVIRNNGKNIHYLIGNVDLQTIEKKLREVQWVGRKKNL